MRGKVKWIGAFLTIFVLFSPGWAQEDEESLAEEYRKALTPQKGFTLRGVHKKPVTKPTLNINIPFELNSYHISSRALPYLQALGKALTSDELKDYVFEIQGHTCILGRHEYNLWLSRQRAEAVRDYLVKNFHLSKDQFIVIGYGPDKPATDNSTEEGRRKNRRVTVVNTLQVFSEGVEGHRSYLKDVHVIYLRNGEERRLNPGEVLTEEDHYDVRFIPSQHCYVYIYQRDSGGDLFKIFPNQNFSTKVNPIIAGESYRIPERLMEWLRLDESKGKEEIILIAYPEELKNPQEVISKTRAIIVKPVKNAAGSSEIDFQRAYIWRLEFIHR